MSVGRQGFVAEYGLLDDTQQAAAAETTELVKQHDLRTVRVIWVDQHGAPRCKFLSSGDYLSALKNGLDFSAALLSLDTANQVFTPLFVPGGGFDIPELTGFPDMVLVPDPTTFKVLPWADRTGWVICDAYFNNGKPVPLDARRLLRQQLNAAVELGYDYVSGLEVEFYIVRRDTDRIELTESGWPPPPPKVSVLEQGYQYLSEVRLGGINAVVERLRDTLIDLGLPLRSIEDEWGPGQLEVTLDPMVDMGTADAMILFRSAVKQVSELLGCHATFMTRPALPNFFSSGWHLHQSLRDRDTAKNAFTSHRAEDVLSPVGTQFAAGLIEHARAATVFSTPTITGYKRYKPYSFAPDRTGWAVENRGAFLRVQGGPTDPGAHLENRVGEPCANPYYYLAANIASGLDGVRRRLTPPPLVESDPYADDAPRLPASLWEAVDLLEKDEFFAQAFGEGFVKFVVAMKRNECNRFLGEVTDWEMREYFEFF
ncbi:MAG TPA: glutamine synthetase family protein [Jatrophihabitans sp.]|nr:glutamine synthetase family protein [Jatrophihabitans sp.]